MSTIAPQPLRPNFVNDDDPMGQLNGSAERTVGVTHESDHPGNKERSCVPLTLGQARGDLAAGSDLILGQVNRVFSERGYPTVSEADDIEQAISSMVQDAQDGWTCFADAEACRLLYRKNSHHA